MSGRCKACNTVFLPHEGKYIPDVNQFEELCNHCLKVIYGNPEDEKEEEEAGGICGLYDPDNRGEGC